MAHTHANIIENLSQTEKPLILSLAKAEDSVDMSLKAVDKESESENSPQSPTSTGIGIDPVVVESIVLEIMASEEKQPLWWYEIAQRLEGEFPGIKFTRDYLLPILSSCKGLRPCAPFALFYYVEQKDQKKIKTKQKIAKSKARLNRKWDMWGSKKDIPAVSTAEDRIENQTNDVNPLNNGSPQKIPINLDDNMKTETIKVLEPENEPIESATVDTHKAHLELLKQKTQDLIFFQEAIEEAEVDEIEEIEQTDIEQTDIEQMEIELTEIEKETFQEVVEGEVEAEVEDTPVSDNIDLTDEMTSEQKIEADQIEADENLVENPTSDSSLSPLDQTSEKKEDEIPQVSGIESVNSEDGVTTFDMTEGVKIEVRLVDPQTLSPQERVQIEKVQHDQLAKSKKEPLKEKKEKRMAQGIKADQEGGKKKFHTTVKTKGSRKSVAIDESSWGSLFD